MAAGRTPRAEPSVASAFAPAASFNRIDEISVDPALLVRRAL
jgi:hypothetical protein